ncbi:MAG: aminopeptidase, partial [Gammaproteobacteria bacterium]|nr:aminopeptidase [Gammaproteobacteria bacterium]
YLQSARGQLDLLSRRVAIEKLIEDPETSNELRDRLVTVNAIREFASAELGLPDNRSYRGYADLERAYVVWNVFAAPEFSVEPESWCFPIVGCVTYRGYFKEHSAQKFAAQLAADGLDVYVAGIAAYSTLGRFADPVLNTMLSGDDLYLAGLIFHELSHQLFYIKDATEFNESFAMLIEEEGVRRWLVHNENEQAWDGWLARRVRAEQFNQIVSLARENLMALYATDIDPAQMRAEKQLVMAQLKKSHERLRTQWGGHSSYEGWFAGPLNNAQLSSVATYTLLVPALRVLLSQSANDLAIFYQRVQEIGALPVEEREQILQKLGARSGH